MRSSLFLFRRKQCVLVVCHFFNWPANAGCFIADDQRHPRSQRSQAVQVSRNAISIKVLMSKTCAFAISHGGVQAWTGVLFVNRDPGDTIGSHCYGAACGGENADRVCRYQLIAQPVAVGRRGQNCRDRLIRVACRHLWTGRTFERANRLLPRLPGSTTP